MGSPRPKRHNAAIDPASSAVPPATRIHPARGECTGGRSKSASRRRIQAKSNAGRTMAKIAP